MMGVTYAAYRRRVTFTHPGRGIFAASSRARALLVPKPRRQFTPFSLAERLFDTNNHEIPFPETAGE
ncbi:MAG: hypothetical protein HOO98_01975 [Nitrospira sp.]|nr:hypothetical protein [Nitrospira sp.]